MSATFVFSKCVSKLDSTLIDKSLKINEKIIPDRCVTSHDIDKNIQFASSSWQKMTLCSSRKEIDLAMPQGGLKRRKGEK